MLCLSPLSTSQVTSFSGNSKCNIIIYHGVDKATEDLQNDTSLPAGLSTGTVASKIHFRSVKSTGPVLLLVFV